MEGDNTSITIGWSGFGILSVPERYGRHEWLAICNPSAKHCAGDDTILVCGVCKTCVGEIIEFCCFKEELHSKLLPIGRAFEY